MAKRPSSDPKATRRLIFLMISALIGAFLMMKLSAAIGATGSLRSVFSFLGLAIGAAAGHIGARMTEAKDTSAPNEPTDGDGKLPD